MGDINQLEKEKLYQWACNNHTKEIEEEYFTIIDRNCKTYYEERNCSIDYCREYTFETASELRNELNKLWKDDPVMRQIYQVVIVAAMKNKQSKQEDTSTGHDEHEHVKSYIYEF